jgi:hypothetical protein
MVFDVEGRGDFHIGSLNPSVSLASPTFTPGFFEFAGHPPFDWSRNSRFVWGASQDRINPSGWAASPLRPLRVQPDGQVELLPELTYERLDLDALLWVGGDGLALALFGARGGTYRPPRTNPEPTLAIVDARRGVVIQAVPFRALTAFQSGLSEDAAYAAIWGVSAVVTPSGKVRAVLRTRGGDWLLWTEQPQALKLDYGRAGAGFALTPDGKHLLVTPFLQASGVICEHNPKCPAPTPETGVIAALHELSTGKAIWTRTATTTKFEAYPWPAVSPDGKVALMGFPSPPEKPTNAALISMIDGGVLQTLPNPWGSEYAVGFIRDGRSMWLRGGPTVAFYDLVP